jgi:hypothetical protein
LTVSHSHIVRGQRQLRQELAGLFTVPGTGNLMASRRCFPINCCNFRRCKAIRNHPPPIFSLLSFIHDTIDGKVDISIRCVIRGSHSNDATQKVSSCARTESVFHRLTSISRTVDERRTGRSPGDELTPHGGGRCVNNGVNNFSAAVAVEGSRRHIDDT